MFEKSLSNIPESYYISKEKIYTRNENNYKISNVQKFDAKKFAEWMQKGFSESSLKTIASVAKEAKSNSATISRLMSGASQTTNGKPSQPNKDLVERLAKLFNADVDEALMLAGYAPKSLKPYPKEFVMDYDGFDDEDLIFIRQTIDARRAWKEKQISAQKYSHTVETAQGDIIKLQPDDKKVTSYGESTKDVKRSKTG